MKCILKTLESVLAFVHLLMFYNIDNVVLWNVTAINAGGLVAMGISGVLVHAGGWPLAFYFFGVVAVLWFIPWLYLIYNTPDEHPRISSQEKEYIQSGFSEATNKKLVGSTFYLFIEYIRLIYWGEFFYCLTGFPTYSMVQNSDISTCLGWHFISYRLSLGPVYNAFRITNISEDNITL